MVNTKCCVLPLQNCVRQYFYNIFCSIVAKCSTNLTPSYQKVKGLVFFHRTIQIKSFSPGTNAHSGRICAFFCGASFNQTEEEVNMCGAQTLRLAQTLAAARLGDFESPQLLNVWVRLDLFTASIFIITSAMHHDWFTNGFQARINCADARTASWGRSQFCKAELEEFEKSASLNTLGGHYFL